MNEYKNRRNFYIVILVLALIALVTGVTYAWFSYTVTGDNVTVNSGTLKIEYKDGNKIDASNLKPATKEQAIDYQNNCEYERETTEKICAKYTFTIENTGTLRTAISVNVDNLVNTYSKEVIRYVLVEGDYVSLTDVEDINIFYKIFTTQNNLILLPNETKTYTLLIWLDERATNLEQDKTLSGTLIIKGEQINYHNETGNGCYAFTPETKTITRYYEYEYDDPSNKECPKDVVIPRQINGINVEVLYDATTVEKGVFHERNITSVVLPNTLKIIGGYSFKNNKLTGTLSIPNSVTAIGISAFEGNSDGSTNQISSLIFELGGTNPMTIGDNAFRFNALRGTLTIPKTVVSISMGAFRGNSPIESTINGPNNSLTGLIFENDSILQIIGGSAFFANELTTVTIPNSVEIIDYAAFRRNNPLTQVINLTGKAFLWCNPTNGIIEMTGCSPAGSYETTTINITGDYARIVEITSS